MPVRRKGFVFVVLAGALGVCLVSTAHGGIIGMSMSGGDISSLYLSDGTWDQGPTGDWYYTINPEDSRYGELSAYEHWIGGNPVDFNMGVEADTDPDVTITKTLNNDTSFDWTDFHIDLIPQPGQGPITVYPGSVGSSRFSDSAVTNNPDGSAEIDWFTDPGQGDTPVLIGETVSLFFTFNIPGSVAFNMVQVPTPEPATLSLLVLGGLAVARRRR